MTELSYKEFIALALRDEKFGEIKNHIISGNKRAVSVIGPSGPHKAYLLNSLSEITSKKLCILASDELRAREMVKEFSGFNDKKIVVFRQRELNFLDIYASSREDELERLGVISKILLQDYDICIVTAQGAVSKLSPAEKFKLFCKTIKPGDDVPLDDFCAYLSESGYERVKLSESPGQFSRRGDLLDIILPHQISRSDSDKTGIRISFFGDAVDAVKVFDVNTQRSLQMQDEANIYPAREILIEKKEKERIIDEVYELQQKHKSFNIYHDIERLEEDIYFNIADRYIWSVYPDPDSIFEYFDRSNCLFVVDEPTMANNRMDAYNSDFYEKFKSLLLKEKVLPEFSNASFTRGEVISRIEKIPGTIYTSVISGGKNIPAEKLEIQIASKEINSFRGKEKELAQTIKSRDEKGLNTVLMIGDKAKAEHLSSYLKEYENVIPVITPIFAENGFEFPGANTLFIGNRQIFGSAKRGKRKHKKGITIDLFSDLKPGELVVHEDHGIGRYNGLVNIDSNGSKRDYLQIVYDKSDTLYIPIESFDKIQKYVGSQGKEPRLSKLGGQEWLKLKERAKSSVKKLATNLLSLYAKRMAIKGFAFSADTVWQMEFEEDFEYEETPDQIKSIEEIKSDMESDKVMDRLLCGDVGFGKTEVAFRAIFKCVMDGKQAAILVPTTVLAQQHYENLRDRLKEFPVRVGLLSRFASDAMIKETKRELASGSLEIVIGTHRVLSKDVRFKDLGLLVIDEEQRFGVDHKEKLKDLFPNADVLTLTATPIPRTLHMSIAGIRDISIIEDPPADRRAVQTYVMEYDEEIVAEAMLREISRNGQVFYLFNNTSRIIEKAASLEKMLPGAKIVYAHGRMPEGELENIINSFVAFEADVLVCTTIIESGIDMPNVNTIIVENADKLGLAQLYQLRGRVGRSQRQAYSYITYTKDKVLSEIAQKRLAAIRDYTELGSGFKIALRDLEVRGAGNLLGAMQHGNMDAVGYDLYCKMLEEEIKIQSGKQLSKSYSATVEFKIDAYISNKYIPDEGQRMDMYRKIGRIEDLESYIDIQDEMTDRYGDIPDQIITLTNIAYIRGFAPKAGFERIFERDGSVVLMYREDFTPDMEVISYILGIEKYKGKILFNAQSKPYLVYRNGAKPIERAPERVRKLFNEIEKKLTVKKV